ncbi:MAG: hypothetical protein M1359_09605 [Betaproteobacteria bacterium]|nr:hypothetical protein [Betaproteobacteria bacterium]
MRQRQKIQALPRQAGLRGLSGLSG